MKDKREVLKNVIKHEINSTKEKLESLNKELNNVSADVSKEMLEQRDSKRALLESLSSLFDEAHEVDINHMEVEYNVISTDNDDGFIVFYLDPNTGEVTFSSSSNTRDDALDELRKKVEEQEGKKIKEKAEIDNG